MIANDRGLIVPAILGDAQGAWGLYTPWLERTTNAKKRNALACGSADRRIYRIASFGAVATPRDYPN